MTYFKGSVWVLIFNLVFCVVLLYNCKSDRVTVLTNTKSEPLSIELQKVNYENITNWQIIEGVAIVTDLISLKYGH